MSGKTSIALLVAALALLAATAPARAQARPVIGIGEQKAGMFDDPRWQRLGLPDVRYIAPWDALSDPDQLATLDEWMAAAHAAGARVVLGFTHSERLARRWRRLPGPRRFEREFLAFRARYPYVRDWIVWNEANHPAARTARRPGLVARYFDAVDRNCRYCRVVGADVLDIRGMRRWVHAFRRHAHARPAIWGLHNYVDANNFSSRGTRALLAMTRGQVWFTETGGFVLRRKYRHGRVVQEVRYSLRHAARATLYALDLARLSRRIRRVYLYHWRAPWTVTSWDSAFIGPRGATRPAYRALLRRLRSR
jgi:hypothetical protein